MATFDRGNPFQTELFQKNVLDPYLRDYRNVTNYARFMGGADAIIYNKMENKGQGDRIVYPLRQVFDPIVSLGNEELEGNESELTYVDDMVDIGRFRFAIQLTDLQLMLLQTKFQLESDVRSNLLDQADVLNTRRITSQFALAFPGPVPLLNQQFSYAQLTARMLAADLDTPGGGGMSRARVVLGDNYLVTHPTFTDALDVGNLPVADHHLTVKHIRSLTIRAKTGRSGVITGGGGAEFIVQESAIRPYKYKTHNGFEDKRYVLFVSPEAYLQLVVDPEWQAQANRGVIENENQPSVLYGSMYKGTIEGVMVIEIPEFSNLTITNAAGNTYAYSALCGASAIGFAMGATPTFTERSSTDYELHQGLAHNEISGLKPLKFPSKSRGVRGNNINLVEYGMIHSLTTIA